jgi:hypothetical protein
MSENLTELTVKELKEYADTNSIDLEEAKTKADIVAKISGVTSSITEVKPEENSDQIVITGPDQAPKAPAVSNLNSEKDGIIGSKVADKPVAKAKHKEEAVEKVAIWSPKNSYWEGIGKVKAGYNIVTKEASAKWLTRKGVRLATPQEMATFYGKE